MTPPKSSTAKPARSETEQLLIDIGLLNDPSAPKPGTGKKTPAAKKPTSTPVQNNEKSRQASQGLVTLMSSKERYNAFQKGDSKDKWNPVVGWAHVRGTHVSKAPSLRPAPDATPDRAGSAPSRPAGKPGAPKKSFVQPSATFVQPRQTSEAPALKLSSAQDKYVNWFADSDKL